VLFFVLILIMPLLVLLEVSRIYLKAAVLNVQMLNKVCFQIVN
jgi:hypothetical protein